MRSQFLNKDTIHRLYHRARKRISGAQLRDQRDRTLLLFDSKYGWTQHVYVKDGKLVVLRYRNKERLLASVEDEALIDHKNGVHKITGNDDILRAMEYQRPESTDFEFAELLMARGFDLDFCELDIRRAKRLAGKFFHGLRLEQTRYQSESQRSSKA